MSTIIDTLVYDRTQDDVDALLSLLEKVNAGTATDDELTQLKETDMKGAYNYGDLNRVGEAVSYLAERLAEYGITVSVTPKTDWTEEDIPTASDTADYLADIRTLRGAITAYSTTPDTPADMEALTHEEANAIEKILYDLDAALTAIAAAWLYSGEVYAGEA